LPTEEKRTSQIRKQAQKKEKEGTVAGKKRGLTGGRKTSCRKRRRSRPGEEEEKKKNFSARGEGVCQQLIQRKVEEKKVSVTVETEGGPCRRGKKSVTGKGKGRSV